MEHWIRKRRVLKTADEWRTWDYPDPLIRLLGWDEGASALLRT